MGIFKRSKEPKPHFIRNEDGMFYARLLFENETVLLDHKEIDKALAAQFTTFNAGSSANKNSISYFFKDYPVSFAEGIIPGQCVLIVPDKKTPLATDLDKLYNQQWHWNEAREKTSNLKTEILINDLRSRPLPYKKRVEMFQKFVYAVSKALKPVAIYFPSSEKIIPTEMYFNQIDQDGFTSLFGLLNVRYLPVKQDNSNFMDTIGMHTLGLPDFQIRFKDLNPADVAPLLYSYADYIFKNGSIIENGKSIAGVTENSLWKCVYQGASLNPKRNVLNLSDDTN